MTGVRELPEDWVLAERALRLTQIFAQWPAAAMEQLLSISRVGRYARGDVVTTDDAPKEILAVVSGHIVGEVTVDAAASRCIVALLGPGYVLGFVRSFDDEDVLSAHRFRALNDTVIVHMPAAQFYRILEEDPGLWREMAKLLMKQFRQVLQSLLTQSVGSFKRRLAATIERLAMLHGSKEGDGIGIRLRLTQEDLAALLQVTRQSVNKELGALVACGAISWNYNIITVLDPQALRAMAAQAS